MKTNRKLPLQFKKSVISSLSSLDIMGGRATVESVCCSSTAHHGNGPCPDECPPEEL